MLDIRKNKIKILILVCLLLVCSLPSVAQAQFFPRVPCDGVERECNLQYLIAYASAILGFIVTYLAFPLATLTIAWAGMKMMLGSNNPTERTAAKKMIYKVVIGFAVLLAAHLIVKTVIVNLGSTAVQGTIGF